MTTERLVVIMAGFFVMLSLALGMTASPVFMHTNWLWFTAFVGLNLFQSGITGFCPANMIFKKLGFPSASEANAS